MLVSEIISQARSGELNNLSEEAYDDSKVINYINLALVELYKRFTLESGEALVTMRTGKTIYKLDGTDSDVSMPDGRYSYILNIYDEDGKEIKLNDDTNPLSIFTVSYNAIQVPVVKEGEMLSVIYSMDPTTIVSTADEVPLPTTLIEALLHYIGYRAHGAMDGNVDRENNTHYRRFEASCARAEALGVVMMDNLNSISVADKGFV